MAEQGFIYTVECIDKDGNVKWTEQVHNIIPTEGWNYFINAAMANAVRYSSWYVGLYVNNYAPVAGDTMATLAVSGSESVAYSEPNRPAFTLDPVANGLVTNYIAPAEFTFTADTTLRGGFITSSSVKGGTTGLLLSAALFSTPRSVLTGEGLRVKAGVQLTSS
jgi:hypothetical protein